MLLVTLAACTAPDAPGTPAEPAAPSVERTAPSGVGPVLLVLPPADELAPAARAALRAQVDDAVATAGTDVTVLEPATRAALPATVELAARRAAAAGAVPGGAPGTVCVLGGRQTAALASALARYPAATGCRTPAAASADPAADAATSADGDGDGDGGGGLAADAATGALAVDVDLGRLGRALGVAARAAAGGGGVVVLDAGDPLLDRRWRDGVLDGAREPLTGTARTHVATGAAEVVALLDAQAALRAAGITPGSPRTAEELAEGRAGAAPDGAPTGAPSGASVARTLPPVGAVVLDASVDAAVLADVLADRGIAVAGPAALLATADPAADVVLRTAVRWERPLGVLLARAVGADAAAPDVDDVLRLTPGTTGDAGDAGDAG